ncbi:VirB4 family type IV secretion system protein [Senegalia massiliensis]|uniref:DUF87 domain-containing protein n=1 Tax=Senegalia massiliensis TaxID=1720316 RepID=A0A845R226_9CLOT|nr:DUF87 domain-containing protein [Senegalia massiliensis]NBI07598.1 DUF87 domain-containing protein [Senegalia massiliensis]
MFKKIFKKKTKDEKTKDKKEKKDKKNKKKKIETEDLLDKKIDSDTKETIFDKNRKKLKDLIAPDSINFSESPFYGTIGDKYYAKNMYVGLLPNTVNFASFLHQLYNFGNIDTSIYINPIDSETAKSDLSKTRTNLEAELLTAEGNNRSDDMASKAREAQRLRTEIRDGTNKLYEASIISTLYEEDLRDLNNSSDQLKETMGQSDVGIKSATYIQEDTFRSNKPIMNNRVKEWHTFDKRSLACVYPFTSSNINHEGGVPLGFNMDNGLPIFWNNFNESLANYNMVIFAKSGGGKSTFIKMLSARSNTLDKIQNIFIDIEPEYNDICEILGGQIIKIAPDTDTILNPFDITIDIVKNKKTGKYYETLLISEKINSVSAMIMTMAKGQMDNKEYFNDITRMIIKNTVRAEYERLEITSDPESLYEIKQQKVVNGRIVGGKTKKTMPTLSSFYLQLEKLAKLNKTVTYKPAYDYLLMVLQDFCRIKKGSFIAFDGQSTVELSYDIPFINFDVSGLNEKTELPIAQHLITDYIWEHMIKRNNSGHKIRVGIDEAWRMINFPDALDFLITGFRRARKKNTSFTVISQQFDEFYGKETSPIIRNSDTKLFLPPDTTSVDNIGDIFKLTQGEVEFLGTCGVGQGLFITGKSSVKLNIEIPEFEINFVETNQNKKKPTGVGA